MKKASRMQHKSARLKKPKKTCRFIDNEAEDDDGVSDEESEGALSEGDLRFVVQPGEEDEDEEEEEERVKISSRERRVTSDDIDLILENAGMKSVYKEPRRRRAQPTKSEAVPGSSAKWPIHSASLHRSMSESRFKQLKAALAAPIERPQSAMSTQKYGLNDNHDCVPPSKKQWTRDCMFGGSIVDVGPQSITLVARVNKNTVNDFMASDDFYSEDREPPTSTWLPPIVQLPRPKLGQPPVAHMGLSPVAAPIHPTQRTIVPIKASQSTPPAPHVTKHPSRASAPSARGRVVEGICLRRDGSMFYSKEDGTVEERGHI